MILWTMPGIGMPTMRISGIAAGLLRYLLAAMTIVVMTLLFSALRGILDTPVIALLFLIPVGLRTALWGLGPGITAALCAFLGFNYFFISPFYTFTVHRPEDVVVLIVFLVVAGVISQLVARAQAGMATATAREAEATELYELSTALYGQHEEREILHTLAEHIVSTFAAQAVELELSASPGETERVPGAASGRPPDLVIPIQAVQGPIGELRLWGGRPGLSPAQKRLLQAFTSQGALAL